MRSCDFFLIAPYLNLEKLDLLLGEDYSPLLIVRVLRCVVGLVGVCGWGLRVCVRLFGCAGLVVCLLTVLR